MRLIDADVLWEELSERHEFLLVEGLQGAADGTIHAMNIVQCAPAVDTERHGHWFFTDYDYFDCSVCGEAYFNGCESTEQANHWLVNGDAYKFCPHCGARMDGAK